MLSLYWSEWIVCLMRVLTNYAKKVIKLIGICGYFLVGNVVYFILNPLIYYLLYSAPFSYPNKKNSSWRNFLAHECTHEYFYNRHSCLFRLGFMKIMLQLLMHLAVVCLTVLLFICDMSLLFNWSPMFQWLQLPYWQKTGSFESIFKS